MSNARRIADIFGGTAPTANTLQLGDSSQSRLFIPGVGIDTNTLSDNQTLQWNDTTGVFVGISLGSSVTVYDSASLFPLTGNTAGDQAYASDTNHLFLFSGSGWYRIATINATPTLTTSPDAAYDLDSNGGTATTISLTATDSDGTPILWTFTADDSADDLATITNDSNGTFTITAKTLSDILAAGYDSAGGSFDVTFKASDGVNFATAASEFTITFKVAGANDFKYFTGQSPEGSYAPAHTTSSYQSSFDTASDGTAQWHWIFPWDYIATTSTDNFPTAQTYIAGGMNSAHGSSYTAGFDVSSSGEYTVMIGSGGSDINLGIWSRNGLNDPFWYCPANGNCTQQGSSIATTSVRRGGTHNGSSFTASGTAPAQNYPNGLDGAGTLQWNGDGTKFWFGDNIIVEVALTTAYTTADGYTITRWHPYNRTSTNTSNMGDSYTVLGSANSATLNSDTSASHGAGESTWCFSPDGTKLYVYNRQKGIIEYSLGTAFDLSTASYVSTTASFTRADNSATYSLLNTAGSNMVWSADGHMFWVGGGNGNLDKIYSFYVQTPFDSSTVNLPGLILDDNTDLGGFKSSHWTSEKVIKYRRTVNAVTYSLGSRNKNSAQMHLPSDWPKKSGYTDSVAEQIICFDISDDGTKIVWASYTYDTLHTATLTTAWNVSTISDVDGPTDNNATNMTVVRFANNGNYLFAADNQSRIWRMSMSTAYDINSISYATTDTYSGYTDADTNQLLTISGGDAVSILFNTDGTRMYYTKSSWDDKIYYRNLSTTWDISSGSVGTEQTAVALYSLGGSTNPYVTAANSNGIGWGELRLMWMDNGSQCIVTTRFWFCPSMILTMSTPYDLTTATLKPLSEINNWEGLSTLSGGYWYCLSPDGDKMLHGPTGQALGLIAREFKAFGNDNPDPHHFPQPDA